MGSMRYFVNKIITKFEDHREEKERARERQRAYTPSPPHRWSPDPPREPRKRTESYDERYRRHTDPADSSEVKFKLAGYEFLAKKVNRGEGSGRGRNSRSESNLAGARGSRDVIINPGDPRRGRDVSPRNSDGRIARLRSRSQGESSRSNGNNKQPSRSRSNKRYPQSNDGANKQDIPPVPPIPPQWTEEARNKGTDPVPARNLQNEEYQRLQREAAKRKIQKQAVDWDRLKREKNDEVRLAAEKKEREAAEKEAAQKREREIAENKRREAEKQAIRPREWEKAEEKRREAIEKGAARQREWKKAQKWKKTEEAEKRTNADSLLVLEMNRVEAAKRANEARRLAAFGSIGESNSSKTNLASPRQGIDAPRGRTEQQRRPPAWQNGAPAQIGGTGPQGRPLERRDTNPVPYTPAPVRTIQQNSGQQLRQSARSNSNPITVQQAGNRALRPRPKPPVVAPLTEENLRTQRGNFADQAPGSELNRGLGDMTRTFIEGFYVPTELQSNVEDDDEENTGRKIS